MAKVINDVFENMNFFPSNSITGRLFPNSLIIGGLGFESMSYLLIKMKLSRTSKGIITKPKLYLLIDSIKGIVKPILKANAKFRAHIICIEIFFRSRNFNGENFNKRYS